MNGAHRQMMIHVTDSSGTEANQSIRGRPTLVRTQSTTPKTGLSMVVFQPSAPTTGITRNEVMRSVRTMSRPRNRALTRSAISRPSSSEAMTAVDVADHGIDQRRDEITDLEQIDVVLDPVELAVLWAEQVPLLQAEPDREGERRLGHDDGKDQRRSDQAAAPDTAGEP